jgi:hypothetical protein
MPVTTTVATSGPRIYAARFTNISDGTDETTVTKVDLTTLRLANGAVPTSAAIHEIQWSIQGFTSIRLFWGTTNLIDVLGPGNGYRYYKDIGALPPPSGGNISLTTVGAFSGATYDIFLAVRLA